jgi:hypothetical protein
MYRTIISQAFNILFNHDFIFNILGMINKKTGLIKTIFCGYPANNDYLNAYSGKSKRLILEYKFKPFLAGVFIQNKKVGLKFFISASEEEFQTNDGIESLNLLSQRFSSIQEKLCVPEISFAGIIPSVLQKSGVKRNHGERDKVIESVISAIKYVVMTEKMTINTPIIILGSKGYIGREVIRKLGNREIYKVDRNGDNVISKDWPAQLKGRQTLLVNISRKETLDGYTSMFWESLHILNEVYPEPTPEKIGVLKKYCGNIYHLAGVEGLSFPSFPEGYNNAIPCCAAWPSPRSNVVVKTLCDSRS